MNRKMSKIKILLIGFVLLKILVTVVYFTGATSLPDFPFARTTAVAQDTLAEEASPESTEEVTAVDKDAQYDEIQALMNQLELKRLQLKDEEERIQQEREQLAQLKRDIDLKLDELSAVQAKIDASLEEKAKMEAQAQKVQDETEAAKIKQLVKVYTTMSPKQAAKIIDKLDMQVVYEVFSNMKGEQVGQILTYVSEDRAAEITERMASDAIE